MKTSVVLALTGASAAYAFPSPASLDVSADASSASTADDPRFTQWTPPGPGDVRGPCPGLNTLANHGFIPHDGKNMTIPTLISGLSAGMNVGPDFSTAIGLVGVGTSPNPKGMAFDLNDLDQHDFSIEHDASLSRQDAYFGNDYSFYRPNWDQVLAYYENMTHTSIPVASKAKYGRVMDSFKKNPQVVYGPREFILSYGETALYLQTMTDSTVASGVAPLAYVRSMFENETLPYHLGWRPPKQQVNLLTLGQMILELNSANPQANTEDMHVFVDSYKDALEILGGGGEILANLTRV